MNKLATLPSLAVAPLESQVMAACQAAKATGKDYALKAIIAGQMLLEFRAQMARVGTSTNPNGRNQHSEGEGFLAAVAKFGINHKTAYSWMECAERVARAGLGMNTSGAFPPAIEIEGAAPMLLSHALTAPEKGLPEEALTFRQAIFDFMADHTLADAACAVADGSSPGKRITLAAGGKVHGGKGSAKRSDRKDFARFVLENLEVLSSHIARWPKLSAAQKTEMGAFLRAALLGQEVATARRPKPVKFPLWPEEVCELAIETLRERLRERKGKA